MTTLDDSKAHFLARGPWTAEEIRVIYLATWHHIRTSSLLSSFSHYSETTLIHFAVFLCCTWAFVVVANHAGDKESWTQPIRLCPYMCSSPCICQRVLVLSIGYFLNWPFFIKSLNNVNRCAFRQIYWVQKVFILYKCSANLLTWCEWSPMMPVEIRIEYRNELKFCLMALPLTI